MSAAAFDAEYGFDGFSGSVGLLASHCESSLEKASPPIMMMLVAPVAETTSWTWRHAAA